MVDRRPLEQGAHPEVRDGREGAKPMRQIGQVLGIRPERDTGAMEAHLRGVKDRDVAEFFPEEG